MSPRKRPTSQRSLKGNAYHQSVLYQNLAGRQITPPPAPRRHHFGMALAVVLLLALSGHILWSKHVSAVTVAAHENQIRLAAEARQKAATFSSQIHTLLAANPDDNIGIATVSSAAGLQTYGNTDGFDGASVGKLLTAADYLHHVEQGTASLNHEIDGETAASWLQAMIVNSDDTAWLELNTYLTHDDLAAYAQSIGFASYDPDSNTFTAADVALLLQQLYSDKLLDPADRSLLLNYMSRANYRGYIVAAVPAGDSVYHKVGLDDDTINDAAIITHGQKYVILVIFTNGNGSYDADARSRLMHVVTRDATAAFL